MIPTYMKFNDDISVRFIMKNAPISFIKEYRGATLSPFYDVIDDVMTMKNTFCA